MKDTRTQAITIAAAIFAARDLAYRAALCAKAAYSCGIHDSARPA